MATAVREDHAAVAEQIVVAAKPAGLSCFRGRVSLSAAHFRDLDPPTRSTELRPASLSGRRSAPPLCGHALATRAPHGPAYQPFQCRCQRIPRRTRALPALASPYSRRFAPLSRSTPAGISRCSRSKLANWAKRGLTSGSPALTSSNSASYSPRGPKVGPIPTMRAVRDLGHADVGSRSGPFLAARS